MRLDIAVEKDLAGKLGAFWTPTILYMDPVGERVLHRFTGYLPPEEFAPQVLVGTGLVRHQQGKLDAARACFQETTRKFPGSFFASEGIYWDGVADYRQTGKPDGLQAACRRILDEYPGTIRARKVEYVKREQDAGAAGKRRKAAGG